MTHHVHEKDARLVEEEMIMQRGHFKPLSRSADITDSLHPPARTRSPIITSFPPSPLVIASISKSEGSRSCHAIDGYGQIGTGNIDF